MAVLVARESIPDIIQAYMTRRGGMSQKTLAGALGVTPSNVSNWLGGSTRPSAESCLAIARVTGRDPLDVLEAAGFAVPRRESAAPEIIPELRILIGELSPDEQREAALPAIELAVRLLHRGEEPDRYAAGDPHERGERRAAEGQGPEYR